MFTGMLIGYIVWLIVFTANIISLRRGERIAWERCAVAFVLIMSYSSLLGAGIGWFRG